MPVLSDYTSGTISLANGSVTVTGTGTLFEVSRFEEGDTLQIQNLTAVIASVDSDTQLTLTEPWTGTTIVDGPYRARQLGDGSRVSTQAATVIELLGNGVLMNLAELGVEEGKVPVGGPTGEYELADPATFGIQDPNGSLQSIATVTGVQNYGKSLLTLPDAQGARASIGASRPAFRAAVTADRPIGNGASDVELWAIPLNVGNHWNGLRFLAPETGIYLFHWQAQFTDGQGDTGYCIPWIKVNGANAVSTVASKGLFFFPVSVTGVLSLTAGDSVTFALENDGLAGSPALQGTRTFATGILIG